MTKVHRSDPRFRYTICGRGIESVRRIGPPEEVDCKSCLAGGRTEAQRSARLRNERIRNLRCLYANASWLQEPVYRRALRNMVDQELTAIDAEPETIRRLKQEQDLG